VVVIRAAEHKLPVQQTLDAVRAKVEAGARELAARAALAAAAAKVVEARAAGASWEVALKPLGGGVPADRKPLPADAVVLQSPRFVGRRDAALPPELLAAVFREQAPAGSAARHAMTTLGNGNAVVYALTAVKPGETSQDKLDPQTRETARVVAMGEMRAYLRGLRARSDVRYNPRIFE
jgi:hypothetical protein